MNIKRMQEFTGDFLVSTAQIAYVEEAHGAHMLLLQFNEFFRYYIREGSTAPLNKELEILKKYIMIQKMRVGDRFSIELENHAEYRSIHIRRMQMIAAIDKTLTEALKDQDRYVWIRIEIRTAEDLSAEIAVKTEIGEKKHTLQLDDRFPGEDEI